MFAPKARNACLGDSNCGKIENDWNRAFVDAECVGVLHPGLCISSCRSVCHEEKTQQHLFLHHFCLKTCKKRSKKTSKDHRFALFCAAESTTGHHWATDMPTHITIKLTTMMTHMIRFKFMIVYAKQCNQPITRLPKIHWKIELLKWALTILLVS